MGPEMRLFSVIFLALIATLTIKYAFLAIMPGDISIVLIWTSLAFPVLWPALMFYAYWPENIYQPAYVLTLASVISGTIVVLA